MTVPNLIQGAGFPATTVPGLVRAVSDLYAAASIKEGIPAPTIQFGRRYIEQIHAPPRIVIVRRKGPWDGPIQMGAGHVWKVANLIEARLWSAEPPPNADELEWELARYDLADAMRNRFLNVIKWAASGRLEPADADPDAGQARSASANPHGETYVVTFRFLEDVPRDGVVFSVLPSLDPATGLPTPQLSPPPNYAAPNGTISSLTLIATPG